MGIEAQINYQLNKYPTVKKVVKRVYQRMMYAVSPKIKSEGDILRVSPNDPGHEYFFGYYDKSPWDVTDRYMLCLRAKDTWSDVSPREAAQIILIDTKNDNQVTVLAETHAWNVQQGCMLQWLGPKFQDKVLYNDFRNGKYCTVILKVCYNDDGKRIQVQEEKVLDAPVYTVASDGSFALTLDFSRLYRLRPGYGYYNLPEETADEKLPDKPCIWKIDLVCGDISPVLKYTDFANLCPRSEMKGAEHKVNHIMISPSGKRFMVLHRWFSGQRKYTRLVTGNVDGTDLYVLSDDDMVSHCCWRNDTQILAFENKKQGKNGEKGGSGYYLMQDQTQKYKRFWPEIENDGHPSYSPDGSRIVFDRYPDRARMASVMVSDAKNRRTSEIKTIAKVFAPFKYDNDTRCDLHPRWNRAGDKICFDSVFEGHRGLYVVDVPRSEKPAIAVFDHTETDNNEKHLVLKNVDSSQEIQGLVSCIIPTFKRCDTIPRAIESVLRQTYQCVEVIVVDDNDLNDEYNLEVKKILRKYSNDHRVRYIQQEVHKNGAVARNVGIKNARGEFVAFLDDDDEWLPNKIEEQINILSKNKNIGGVSALWTMFQGDRAFRQCQPYSAEKLQFKILLREVAVFTSTVIMRRDIVLRFGGFDETLFRHQDLQFLVDATDEVEFAIVEKYLVNLHTDSEINRPNVYKLIDAKKAFFMAENEKLKKYDKKEQERVKNAHYYEIVFSALKSKNITIAIKYMAKAGINIASMKDLYKRMKAR